jgi:hypothetical protein
MLKFIAYYSSKVQVTVVPKLNRAEERNGLYIVSFLTFFVTFLCQDKKVNNKIAFVK